jgi:3-hydroxybutyrate dehydrogenase
MAATVNENTHALKGRVALITGGSRGIGKAIALHLAGKGASVAVCARSSPQLEEIAQTIDASGGRCYAAACDIRHAEQIESFVRNAAAELGQIDILVNNAGVYKTEPVASHSLSSWQQIIDTNLTGAMLFCRAVVPAMSERGWGRIINMSSVSGRVGEIWGSAYSASKFGMIGLTQSLALEVASRGVTVNAVCPGWVATELTREQLADPDWCKLNSMNPEQAMQNAVFAVPQNRFIEPEEIAALVAFLASDAARGITGQAINICGGLSLQ